MLYNIKKKKNRKTGRIKKGENIPIYIYACAKEMKNIKKWGKFFSLRGKCFFLTGEKVFFREGRKIGERRGK